MKKISTTLAVAFLLVSSASFAGTSTGQVTSVYVHAPDSYYSAARTGVVMFKAGTPSGTPTCANYGEWAISLDTALGNAMLNTLLTAVSTGKTVTVVGTNYDCADWSDRERPLYVKINN